MPLLSPKEISIQIVEESAHICRNSTVQIFYLKDNEKIKAHATGVLFEFRDNYFIVTAGHVLNNIKLNELYIATLEFKISIEKEVYSTSPSQQHEADLKDYLDIAVIRLD